jgi:hypothetical protein
MAALWRKKTAPGAGAKRKPYILQSISEIGNKILTAKNYFPEAILKC